MDPFIIPKKIKTSLIKQLDGVYIADGAKVIGNVNIGRKSSIWYNTVIRGDVNKISIGKKTNIQDNSTLHVANDNPCLIGAEVTIGHNCIIHGCTIENGVLIGMGAIILNGAVIKKGSIIGAGTLIKENEIVESYSLYVGVPGRKIKSLDEKSFSDNLKWAEKYYQLSLKHSQ